MQKIKLLTDASNFSRLDSNFMQIPLLTPDEPKLVLTPFDCRAIVLYLRTKIKQLE